MTRFPLVAAALAITLAAPVAAPVAAQTSVTAGLTVDGTVITIQVDRPAAAQGPAYGSYWQMRGSSMGLVAEGSARRFHYIQPRDGLAEFGVRPGSVAFEGHRLGDRYEGRAWVFNARCGPHAYGVSGSVSWDSRQVVLSGVAPDQFDSACNVVSYQVVEAVYNLQ